MVNHQNYVFEKEPQELFFKNTVSVFMVVLCVPQLRAGVFCYWYQYMSTSTFIAREKKST